MRKVWERELFFLCYYIIGGNMKTTSVNSFDQTLKYKLYRTVYEIIHPTISKKNISSYRIVFNEDVLPVRVFYPKKVSNISRVIIYVPGIAEVTGCLGDYAEICRNIAHETEELVVALDLDDIDSTSFLEVFDWCYKSFLYLKEELEKLGILDRNITLMGDSIGASVILGIARRSKIKDSRLVLFYPVVSASCLDRNSKGIDSLVIKKIKKFYKEHVKDKKLLSNEIIFPDCNKDYKYENDMLFIVGNADPLKEDIFNYYNRINYDGRVEFLELEFCGHGFLNEMDEFLVNEVSSKIIEFLK